MTEHQQPSPRVTAESPQPQRAVDAEAPLVDSLVQRLTAAAGANAGVKPGSLTKGAILTLQRTAGNQAVNRLLRQVSVNRVPSSGSSDSSVRGLRAAGKPGSLGPVQPRPAVQRYQAGERGHGGIEQEGLRAAGFGGDMESGDIGKIYFGNWMRDFSQLSGDPNSRSGKLIFHLLNILAEGEFGRPLDPAELGGYLPSEHMDNPLGGGNVEDPTATAADIAKSNATLSKDQQQAVARENTLAYKDMIARAAKASGLPPYIERGKQHCKDMFAKAIAEGDTDAGKMHLGNGLHGIEDYFSHSNFTEVALTLLAHDGNVAAWKLLGNAVDAGDGFNAATAGGKDAQGRNGIITGTYGDESHSANQKMSMIEQLKSEVLTGALRLAFIKGSAIVAGQDVAGAGKTALGVVGKGIGEGLGAAEGAREGMAGGMQAGYEAGHGFFGTIESTMAGAAHGLMTGGEQGAETGGRIGEHAGGAVGQAVGKVGGEVDGGVGAAFLVLKAAPLFAAIQAAVALDLDEKLSAGQARASAQGAPAGLPTHSQVAKDAPENLIFPASRALAVHADTEVGEAIAVEWRNPDKSAATRRLQAMVDMIVAHPSTNRAFWEPILLGVLSGTASK